MSDLVLEATGIDFGSYAGDLEGAKAAALEAFKKEDMATRPVVSSLSRELIIEVLPYYVALLPRRWTPPSMHRESCASATTARILKAGKAMRVRL